MLFHLSALFEGTPGLDAFRAAETRAILAVIVAFLTALAFGRWFVRLQKRGGAVEDIRKSDSHRLVTLHLGKTGTPTMGGAIILVALAAATLVCARVEHRVVALLFIFSLGGGVVGFIDDWIKLRTRRKGLTARAKLLAQIALGAVAGWYLLREPLPVVTEGGSGGIGASLFLPFLGGWYVHLGGLYVVLVALVTSGTANAVNLTDGLDGLAAGCSTFVAAALVLLALLQGHEGSSEVFRLPHVADALEVAVFGSALVGACLGFLWFNCHPAQIFMGDTGSLAIGNALGLMAILLKQELLLVLLGGVLVAEVVSVALQVLSFRLTGKRLFLIAPLHHHFQFLGWKETEVTVRFWIAGAVCAGLGLVAIVLR